MSRRKVRSRLRALDEVRFLTDGEAVALLAADKHVEERVVWHARNGRFTRMQVGVVNALGEHLSLTGQVSALRPGASSWALVWGRKGQSEHPEAIRRLDLRGTHRNPDGQWWRCETHKHRWSAADNNDWAYTPDDIPHDVPGSVVGVDSYREIFEAFAAECDVSLGTGYEWADPALPEPPVQIGLWRA